MRPVLVLLNGLPASGKSTLARRWCELGPARLPLALDVDVLRGMLGGWRDLRIEAGLAARAMAVAAARIHLEAGHDVIVPQHLRRPEFIDELADAARAADAAFLECALLVDRARVLERLDARSAAAGRSDVEGDLDEPMRAIEAAFARFLETRPGLIPLHGEGPVPVEQLDRAVARARVR